MRSGWAEAVAGLALLLAAGAAPAQPSAFVDVIPTEGRAAVRVAVAQVVRIGRAEGATVIDTTAYVQQRSIEPAEAVARRIADAGLRLVALTDPSGGRVWVAPDKVVLVRESAERHASGARTAIVMIGLRFSADVAVRESPDQVMTALRPSGPDLELPLRN